MKTTPKQPSAIVCTPAERKESPTKSFRFQQISLYPHPITLLFFLITLDSRSKAFITIKGKSAASTGRLCHPCAVMVNLQVEGLLSRGDFRRHSGRVHRRYFLDLATMVTGNNLYSSPSGLRSVATPFHGCKIIIVTFTRPVRTVRKELRRELVFRSFASTLPRRFAASPRK